MDRGYRSKACHLLWSRSLGGRDTRPPSFGALAAPAQFTALVVGMAGLTPVHARAATGASERERRELAQRASGNQSTTGGPLTPPSERAGRRAYHKFTSRARAVPNVPIRCLPW
jgi:hypothetical protein